MKEELLTGKNKEEFEKWCNQNKKLWNHTRIEEKISDWVLNSPFEMQLGVLLSYYSEQGYEIEKDRYLDSDMKITGRYEVSIYDYILDIPLLFSKVEDSEIEAYKEAFIKANELMNKELEK